MGLSRLDNFLKSTRGTVLYVDPNSLDSTDSVENQGNSLTRPFKTIQRALIESARFSYQQGLNNDRFGKTTIILYPGDHYVDNRPGWIPNGSSFLLRDGTISSDFNPWDQITNFDLTTQNNTLYKLNSIYGGVIVPRGTSIVGMDLRKTKIRPTYVPNPANDAIERSAVFRVTGGCYFWQFTVLDAEPNGYCYKDYTQNTFVPNFSHHKLTAFEYADGYNFVNILDTFITYVDTTRTDLDMYYEKIGRVYGQASGREITPDYPNSGVDIQATLDEYRIVGSRGATVGISSIFAGDGVNSTSTITATFTQPITGLDVDTPIQISGVNVSGYDGQFVVNQVLSPFSIKYQSSIIPTNPSPSALGSTLNIAVDTVNSSSPYIFNISLKSVYGMCGLLADGSKSDGFKSMVVAQFTGIGLQKDDNAFVKYDYSTGQYKDSTSIADLHKDSLSRFKPSYENFHIKATNNSYLQLVSVFAIGFSEHFVAENGGDISINNSNSNFGSKALTASGFRDSAFPQDDVGYVTHVIPPKEIDKSVVVNIEFGAIDVKLTSSAGPTGTGLTSRLYLYNENNEGIPPANVLDGYRVGAKINDSIIVQITQAGLTQTYTSPIIMDYGGVPIPPELAPYYEFSSEKRNIVSKLTDQVTNDISNNIITLTYPNTFLNGESIRIIADNGHIPDGIESNQVYYAIANTSDLNPYQIKIAQTLNDAINGQAVSINNQGGVLFLSSRVSDKNSGDIGHPIQYDSILGNWYINVTSIPYYNQLFGLISSFGSSSAAVAALGQATPRTYIQRIPDTRGLIDTIYRLRYVIPKDSLTAGRPPLDGYILQISNNVIGTGTTEIQKFYNPSSATLTNSNELRNPSFISNSSWNYGFANIDTEIPHKLQLGSIVQITNIQSTNNTAGIAFTGYNTIAPVVGINSLKQFTIPLPSYPGVFLNNTSNRDTTLPYFQRKFFYGTYQVYRSEEIKKYIPNIQDGIYQIIGTNASNSPTVSPYENLRFNQPIQNLYPQIDRDNPVSDPLPSQCFAVSDTIGKVVINDPRYSLSKESLARGFYDISVGFAMTDMVTDATGIAHTIYTAVDHGLSGITSVSIVTGGSGYVQGYYYNARLVGIGNSITGAHATALVTVGAAGTITKVTIMDPGSAYGIGNTLSVIGVGTIGSPGSGAIVKVNNILDNNNETLALLGITSVSLLNYNTLYRVVGVTTGKPKEIKLRSSEAIVGAPGVPLGFNAVGRTGVINGGKSVLANSLTYDALSGLSTITFGDSHGFKVNNKFRLVGVDEPLINSKDFIVKQVNTLNSLTFYTGINNVGLLTSGTEIYAFRIGFGAAGGDVSSDNENTSGRIQPAYLGITTTISSTILSTTSDSVPIIINNAVTSGFKLGDYLQIDDEIYRIKSNVTNNSVSVFRALLGTPRQNHSFGSVVKRITPIPFELRRNSLIRASGHTFEYLGYGPGNYSTALPERQNRLLNGKEQLLAQSLQINGGVSIFTGMDDRGNFYTGNKKINSTTGQEEVYDSPIPTVTGEDPGGLNVNVGFDVLSPLEITVSRSLRVEGGPNRNLISEFDGPVVFNSKITSNAAKGIEANSLLLQGNATVARKYTVGISTPTSAGNAGDVVYRSDPETGGTVGWVYTKSNTWEKFGKIFTNGIDGVGIASGGVTVGLSSLVNFVGVGLTLSAAYDSSGITTVTINGAPTYGNLIGIITGGSYYAGVGTGLNFVGSGISVSASVTPLGIGTVTFSRVMPDSITASSVRVSGVTTSSKFVKAGAASTNFLKADGSDALITYSEVVNALGFTPTNIASLPSSNFPSGNSLVIDDLNLPSQGGPFDGVKTDYSVNISGVAYTTRGGAANLLISIGGVIQKPGYDFTIVSVGVTNTNKIRFTTPPVSGLQNFGVALGGQGELLNDPAWNAKGDLVVGYSNDTALTFSVGSNGTVLTADNSQGSGLRWASTVNSATYATTAGIATYATNAGIATNATNINISAITSTDTTTSIVLVGNQSTGYQNPFIDSGLTYNANSNTLSVTASNATNASYATTAGIATNATNINISATTSTDAITSILLVGNQSTGYQNPFIDSGLTYDALNDVLNIGSLNATGISTVSALNINTTGIGLGDLGSDGGGDGVFGIYNTTNSGIISIITKTGAGIQKSSIFDSNGNLTIPGTLTQNSDIKLKTNIQTIPNALNKVLQLRGVEFDRIDMGGEHQIGLIAQEVEEIIPEVILTNNETKSVSYGNLVAVLIEAIKELKNEVEDLKSKINSYNS
jgi:hypothetical protein